jgi:hypothetical protein
LIVTDSIDIYLSHVNIAIIRNGLCHLFAYWEWGIDKLKDGYFAGFIGFTLLSWVMDRLLGGLGHQLVEKDYKEYKSAQIKESQSRKVHFYMFN